MQLPGGMPAQEFLRDYWQKKPLVIRQAFAGFECPVSADELADARTFLTGSYPLRFTSNSSIANQLIGIQIENLGIDYVDRRNGLIEAVTQDDIARVARRLLRADDLVVTIVGRPNLAPAPEGLPETGDMAPVAAPGRQH